MTIWGNHSSTQFHDVRHAVVTVDGADKAVYDAVADDAWLTGDFVTVTHLDGDAQKPQVEVP